MAPHTGLILKPHVSGRRNLVSAGRKPPGLDGRLEPNWNLARLGPLFTGNSAVLAEQNLVTHMGREG